jgi:glycosyltransferase involved in cell wall biosynthesis
MFSKICVIIPVLNEADTIAGVIESLQELGLTQICVVDNGSQDRTSTIATQAGAQVISEPRRGYGQACWSGMQTPMATAAEWVLFCDGDGSDDLSQLPDLLARQDEFDLILGNRRGTDEGKRGLTTVQNFGNWLVTRLIWLGWGVRYEDLGPLRLIRRSTLDQLAMEDRGFGWTVEMQAKAADAGLRIYEFPVNYLPRQGGQSKIAGTVKGSLKAGQVILTTLVRLYWQKSQSAVASREKIRSSVHLDSAGSAVAQYFAVDCRQFVGNALRRFRQ